jgi:cell division protein FtsW
MREHDAEGTMLGRTDVSLVGRWWWTVDRWSLGAVFLLIVIGTILVMAASPPVAIRLGLDPHHFVYRQLLMAGPAMAVLVATSLLSPQAVRRIAVIGFVVSLLLLLWTVLGGVEIKGARRWLSIGGVLLQPSELVKPTLAVTTAAVLAAALVSGVRWVHLIAVAPMTVVVGLLLLQPDFGMATVVAGVWFVQLFLAGISLYWVLALAGCGCVVGLVAYHQLPHVAGRIDRFIDPASGDSYQVDTAIEALRVGGLLGRGPGEGQVKSVLPDAHSDFIFAVAGEEFGTLAGLCIISLFAFVVVRGLWRLIGETDLFVLLAATGLLTQLGAQAVINIGVNLHLLPTKGMTLPFISYGGSSMLALAAGTGMLLALTRERVGQRHGGGWSQSQAYGVGAR